MIFYFFLLCFFYSENKKLQKNKEKSTLTHSDCSHKKTQDLKVITDYALYYSQKLLLLNFTEKISQKRKYLYYVINNSKCYFLNYNFDINKEYAFEY